MSEPEEGSLEHAWTKENLQKLLTAMKTSFPEQHSKQPYCEGLKAMEWEKVAFSPFSLEECQEKWNEIFQPIRKIRSLTELIDEAEDTISSLKEEPQHEDEACTKWMDKLKDSLSEWRGKKRTYADFLCGEEREGPPPKPPKSGYNLFCQEQKQFMSNVKYLSACAKKWRSMTKEQKDRYSIRISEMQQHYARELNEYLQTFDMKEQESILNKYGLKRPKSTRKRPTRFPGEPKMPLRTCHVIFCKDQMNLLKEKYPNAKERFIKVNQIWMKLPPNEKQSYKDKVNEGRHKYKIELQKWLKTRTPEEQKDYLKKKERKRQNLRGKNLENRSEILHIPSDSEDEDIEVISDEQEDWDTEEEEEEEEEDDDDEDLTFDMY